MLFLLSNIALLISRSIFQLLGLYIDLDKKQCRELRRKGTLRLLVKLLHQHTCQDIDDLSALKSNYEKNNDIRYSASAVAKHIIRETTRDRRELVVWEHLEVMRDFVKSMLFPRSWPVKIYHPVSPLKAIYSKWSDKTFRAAFIEFGGVYVLIDVLQIDSKLHPVYAKDECSTTRYWAIYLLYRSMYDYKEYRTVVAGRQALLASIVEWLKLHQAERTYIQTMAYFFDILTRRTDFDTVEYCGVVECITGLAMKTTDRRTLYWLMSVLANTTINCRANCLAMLDTPGSLRFLLTSLLDGIDTLTDPETPDAEVITPSRQVLPEYMHGSALGLLRNVIYHGVIDKIEELERLDKICLLLVEQLELKSERILTPTIDAIYYLMSHEPRTRTTFKQFGAYSKLYRGYACGWYMFNKTTDNRSVSILHLLWPKRRCRVRW